MFSEILPAALVHWRYIYNCQLAISELVFPEKLAIYRQVLVDSSGKVQLIIPGPELNRTGPVYRVATVLGGRVNNRTPEVLRYIGR